jgi:hypothetical protein
MARLSVGPSWATLTEAQRQQVTESFGRYISAIYLGETFPEVLTTARPTARETAQVRREPRRGKLTRSGSKDLPPHMGSSGRISPDRRRPVTPC